MQEGRSCTKLPLTGPCRSGNGKKGQPDRSCQVRSGTYLGQRAARIPKLIIVSAEKGREDNHCESFYEMNSYTPAGVITKRLRIYRYSQALDLDVVYTFTAEGKVATVKYPNGGPIYQNQYD